MVQPTDDIKRYLIKRLVDGRLQSEFLEDAEKLLHMALNLDPPDIDILLYFSLYFLHFAHNQEAINVCEYLLAINPKLLQARFVRCFACLMDIYKDEKEISTLRFQYEVELKKLRKICSELSLDELSQAKNCIGNSQPFLLAYQGENDRTLQSLYGEIIAYIVNAGYPQWQKPLPLRPPQHKERIRVGIVSGYFRRHSNWRTHLSGWIKQINRNKFALFGYHTGRKCDEYTEEARTYLERLTTKFHTIEEYCSVILEDKLDVLIYPEIGMNAMTMRLAALRLAPVQCVSWGHPDTSGLQTIDFFLSSALMEPPDGSVYYTEKLVCLPNLSIYYEPQTIPELKRMRTDFGLSENAILYWCCQAPMKYLPQHDEVFVKIAREIPDAQFVFTDRVRILTSQLRSRLETSFARCGMSASDYCVFLPYLSNREFMEVSHLMDVFLDSISWSGCNTSLESLGHNLPIVTLPGATMRSRHTSAILTMMNMEDCISISLDDYIARAISLGKNPQERLKMSEQIAVQKHLVYRDKSSIVALEEFLTNLRNKGIF